MKYTREQIKRSELLQAIEEEATNLRTEAAQIAAVAHNDELPGVTESELEQLLAMVRVARKELAAY